MKLKIRNEVEQEDEVELELWLEVYPAAPDCIAVMSKRPDTPYQKGEFIIYPDGSWEKCIHGNLEDD